MIILDSIEYSTDALARVAWAAFVNDEYIKLLINFNESDAVFVDYAQGLSIANDGAAYEASGAFGGCVYFDGSGKKVSVAVASGLNFGTDLFTIKAFVKKNSPTAAYPDFLSNSSPSFGSGFAIRFKADGHIGFYAGSIGDPAIQSSLSYDDPKFYCVDLSRVSSTSLELRVDGVLAGSKTISSSLEINWGGIYGLIIGKNNWDGVNGYFKGWVDCVQIFNGSCDHSVPTAEKSPDITVYSESSIVHDGDYAIKIVAGNTEFKLVRLLTSPFNLSGQKEIKFPVRASRTGSNFKLGFHNSDGTITEITPNITAADTWQVVTLDLSAVADESKNEIDSIILTVLNADTANIIYLDKIYTLSDGEYTANDITAAEAAQLATDQAAVLAASASIKNDTTILGQAGTYDYAAAIAAGYASGQVDGAAAQLAVDQAAVLGKANYIIDSQTILGQAGLYHEAEPEDVEDGVHFGPASAYVGTFAGGSNDYPDPANVLEMDTTNGVPGTYHAPALAEVQKGVAFGPSSSLTGTYSTDTTGDGTVFNDALADMLNAHGIGDDATYTPAGASSTAIKCFYHKEGGPELGMEGYRVWIEAMTSDVSAAKPGETVICKGTTYKIKEPPVKGDDGMSIIDLSED